jgi:predicted nucleotidyltransferase
MAPLLDNVEAIRIVAEGLGPLTDRVVFLGGATVDLLVADLGTVGPRSTKDVDIVVEVASWWAYQGDLRKQLLRRGFREDTEEGAPTCRWVFAELKVDIMPTEEGILGLAGSWFPTAFAEAIPYQLPGGQSIRLVTAPCFLATKLEAFGDRGRRDFSSSVDMEDIIAVIDGRATIEAEIARASNVRAYIAGEIRRHVADEAFMDALPGHLPPDDASQARLPSLLSRLHRIASM